MEKEETNFGGEKKLCFIQTCKNRRNSMTEQFSSELIEIFGLYQNETKYYCEFCSSSFCRANELF